MCKLLQMRSGKDGMMRGFQIWSQNLNQIFDHFLAKKLSNTFENVRRHAANIGHPFEHYLHFTDEHYLHFTDEIKVV